jgi:hypothetical protein
VNNLPPISCKDDPRRQAVRNAKDRYGLDFVEVGTDQKTLHVTFLGRAPQGLKPGNFVITGGERVRRILVKNVTQVSNTADSGLDDTADVTVDLAGDFSDYVLRAVAIDTRGNSTDQPMASFDPVFDSVTFQFKANCPSDLDCKTPTICPQEVRVEPDINYLAKDYQSFRQLILDHLAQLVPDWQETHVPDVSIALVEVLAYVGDHLSYYQDAVATEAYLRTARQRISVRRHARLVDYLMHEGCNARAWICVKTDADVTALDPKDVYFITNFPNAPADHFALKEPELELVAPSAYEVFLPVMAPGATDLNFYAAQSRISFYDWGNLNCCLPRGATSATLKDRWTPSGNTSTGTPAPGTPPTGTTNPSQPTGSGNPNGSTTPPQPAPSQPTGNTPTGMHTPPGVASPAPTPAAPRAAVRSATASTLRATPASTSSATPVATSTPRPRDLQRLKVGDVLIFEEVLGPKTGVPADADPTHRHAVVLTKVEFSVDTLYTNDDPDGVPIVLIEWSRQDALPFALCISSTTHAPDCKSLTDVSISCGNVVLVDHGQTYVDPPFDPVPTLETNATCACECHPAETTLIPGVINPPLAKGPLTFAQPRLGGLPASQLLLQDPVSCLGQIWLTGNPPSPDGKSTLSTRWTIRRDLLESERDDPDYAVEMDDFGIAHLRFGDGECGKQPEAQTVFTARYRIGNGPTGNVGAETIRYLVFRNNPNNANMSFCNPFAAQGGTAPEPVDEVKLLAPHAFRSRIERAVTADDYAALAERDSALQGAAACFKWNGSWYEAVVAIDPDASEDPSQKLLHQVDRELCQYRRVGHDVLVCPAQYVSLDLAFKICVLPDYLRAHVEAALLDAFSNRVLPAGLTGFFYPDNLTFGGGIYLSKLLAAAQSVAGVESVTVTKLERLYEGPNGEIAAGVLPLKPFEIARLDNDPSFPEHGQITFDLRGGR